MTHGKFHVAVNLSARQFSVPDLAGTVGRILGETGLPPQALLLEITETVALANEDNNLEVLRKLRGMGIRIALDDFGTGYSCLANLKDIPAKKLKLDRSFVTVLPHDLRALAVVKAVTQLGRDLGMTVVAEGCENTQQRDILLDIGVDAIQGFLYAHPMPGEELLSWIQQRNET